MYNLEQMKERGLGYIKEINDFLQSFRILCVSEKYNSMKMWDVYAQQHEGIVLRILPNLQKDSKFTQFRAVKYQEKRPPFYGDAASFLEGGLFEDQNERAKMLLNNVIYTKTLEWVHEQEQRLAIPILDGAEWSLMPFHPEEISEFIVGGKDEQRCEARDNQLSKGFEPRNNNFSSRQRCN